MVTTAEQLIQSLIAGGLSTFYGVPGVDTLPVYTAIEGARARSIMVRHEASAAYAADAHFRITGRPAVCLTTGGPGAANTAAAMGEAWASSSTLLHSRRMSPPNSGRWRQPEDCLITTLTSWTNSERSRRSLRRVSERVTSRRSSRACSTDSNNRLTPPSSSRCPWMSSGRRCPMSHRQRRSRSVHRASPSGTPNLPQGGSRCVTAPSIVALAVDLGGTGRHRGGARHPRLAESLDAPVIVTHSAKRAYPAFDHPLVMPFPPHEPTVAGRSRLQTSWS